MYIKKILSFILLVLMGLTPMSAQRQHTEICIDFRVNSTTIDSTYMENATRLKEILFHVNQLSNDTTSSTIQVSFSGVASPEGSYQVNRRLADGRLHALEQYVRTHIKLPDSLVIRHDDQYIPWQHLISEVKASNLTHKEEILTILQGDSQLVPYHKGKSTTIDSRIPALQKLDNGRVWRTLYQRYFAKMRNACAVFITIKKKPLPIPVPIPADTMLIVTPYIHPQPAPTATIQEPKGWVRRLYLKTNAIGLAMGISNIAIEADLGKHWSLSLPVYYSPWDYFKSTIKFRTFGIQPELRYWASENNNGLFTGVHFGLAYYNFAFDGNYRYQDHNRETPAIGGGINIGYRLSISKNKHWWIEFSLGAGIYPLHYDKFHNTPTTKDGLMVESIKKTYWGIDQAAVSFAYSLDLKKEGGKR